MSTVRLSAVALFVSAAVTAAAFSQQPTPPAPASHQAPPLPKELTPPRVPHAAKAEAPDEDLEITDPALNSAPLTSRATAAAVAPAGTNLAPPVTITYAGSSNAVTINDTGTGRGLSSSL